MNKKLSFIFCALFFAVLAVITFRCALPADHVFSASDMNIGILASKKNYLPEMLTGFFTGNQVMGASGSHIILFNVLLALFPLSVFANGFYGAMLVVGSVSMVWFLRIWGRSWFASLFGALVAFWVNSITLASSGHAYKVEVLVFSVLGLSLIEKSVRSITVRRSCGWSILAGLAVGIMLLEQQDVALLAGLFLGPYALFRLAQVHGWRLLRWGCLLVPLAVVALLQSAGTMLRSYDSNIKSADSVQRSSEEKWNYVTQWSAVPEEWPDLIAPGWAGWSIQDETGPYWGKMGQSAGWDESKKPQEQPGELRNFKLDSLYIGIVPFLLGFVGLFFAVKSRKSEEGSTIIFWSIASILGLWLAFGKYSILYKLFYHLPLVGNIRAPVKLLDNFQICLGIVSAYGLDRLFSAEAKSKSTKVAWIVGFVLAGLALFAGVKHAVSPGEQAHIFSEMGYAEKYAELMVQNMSNAWLHAAVLTVIASVTILCAWKFRKIAGWLAAVFVMLLSVDSLMMTSHYFKADDIAALKKGNVVIDYLKKNQGNERIYFYTPRDVIYNSWLGMDGPYHGLNIFNIWQMPRMPVEYREYLDVVGQNPIRLWQLSSIKYIAAPEALQQQLAQDPDLAKLFKPVLSYQVPIQLGTMRPDVLLEFSGSIPRFALFQNWDSVPVDKHCEILVSPQHNPLTTVLVDDSFDLKPNPGTAGFSTVNAEVFKQKAVVQVDVSAPSILRFSQRFQKIWKVYIDGKEAPLLRVDYLAMGVQVPEGKHEVVFKCTRLSRIFIMGGIVAASLVLALLLLLFGRKKSK